MDVDANTAFECHQAGRYADAARRYHALLVREPEHADALHLFGVLHHQYGDHARAVELIGRAVALRPDAAAFHANLAEAYRALGQHEQAVDCCRAALRLPAGLSRGRQQPRPGPARPRPHAEAVEQFRAALRLRPEFAMAQNNLGIVLRELGQTDEALDAFRAAVALDPTSPWPAPTSASCSSTRARPRRRCRTARKPCACSPTWPPLHNNLGNAFRALGALGRGARRLRWRPCGWTPNLARAHANLGLTLQRKASSARPGLVAPGRRAGARTTPRCGNPGRRPRPNEDYAAAIPCCERLLALQARAAQAHNDLGWALQEEGRLAEAAACYAAP